jgi:hypothetical protein
LGDGSGQASVSKEDENTNQTLDAFDFSGVKAKTGVVDIHEGEDGSLVHKTRVDFCASCKT